MDNSIEDWKRTGGWLFASYAAAEGLDNQECEWVFHVGIPMNTEVIIQGNGRCSRKPHSVGLAMFTFTFQDFKTCYAKATSTHRNESDFGFTSNDLTEGEKLAMQRVYSVIPTLDTTGCIREALMHHFEGTLTCMVNRSYLMFHVYFRNREPQ
jgi:superfamily II DNA helicase RecQ